MPNENIGAKYLLLRTYDNSPRAVLPCMFICPALRSPSPTAEPVLRQRRPKLRGQHINSCSRLIHRRSKAEKSLFYYVFFRESRLSATTQSVRLRFKFFIRRSRGKTRTDAGAGAMRRAPCAWPLSTYPNLGVLIIQVFCNSNKSFSRDAESKLYR
jgi:hypothetical protein